MHDATSTSTAAIAATRRALLVETLMVTNGEPIRFGRHDNDAGASSPRFARRSFAGGRNANDSARHARFQSNRDRDDFYPVDSVTATLSLVIHRRDKMVFPGRYRGTGSRAAALTSRSESSSFYALVCTVVFCTSSAEQRPQVCHDRYMDRDTVYGSALHDDDRRTLLHCERASRRLDVVTVIIERTNRFQQYFR